MTTQQQGIQLTSSTISTTEAQLFNSFMTQLIPVRSNIQINLRQEIGKRFLKTIKFFGERSNNPELVQQFIINSVDNIKNNQELQNLCDLDGSIRQSFNLSLIVVRNVETEDDSLKNCYDTFVALLLFSNYICPEQIQNDPQPIDITRYLFPVDKNIPHYCKNLNTFKVWLEKMPSTAARERQLELISQLIALMRFRYQFVFDSEPTEIAIVDFGI